LKKELLRHLINKFEKDKKYYKSVKYNEAQLRTDFLDPLFEILGWDIQNRKSKFTNEREVLLEESLKKDTFSSTKKPDYTFRLFSERKFFVEAKKPNIKIESDSQSAKQVRRYGFTAKLKISVLSNFEYLAIYDCSNIVQENDDALNSRISIYHYTEFENNFNEIQDLIGYESVYSGKFDEKWKDIDVNLKKTNIDNFFLKQINNWRIILGKEIYLHNQNLTEETLNDIVQSYINSLIFLRVCEDRNLENYQTLLDFANSNNHISLIKKFKESDKKYNAGLFRNQFVDEIISHSSSSFWKIIKQLYFPESIYSFSVFSSDILGNIYEVFLGEYLKIEDNKEISLEKKPENIDRDIVTTPNFIIQDILTKTVVKFCQDKSDIEILNSTFADISCGSGAFLLETYQLLHDILIDYYLENDRNKLIQLSISTYKLPFKIKKNILENCIFGIDKDFNAVESTKFGLLLKLLENENNSTISTPALPNLDNNIQCGNSLINFEQIKNDSEIEFINPFNFNNTKFDVIVGNPPYMNTEDIGKFSPLERKIYKDNYISAYKQYDKYFLFIEQGLNLLKENGYLGYIVPNKFIQVGSADKLRKLIKDSQYIQELISFGSNQVFINKTTYTSLLFLQKNNVQNSFKFLQVENLDKWKIKKYLVKNYEDIEYQNLGDIWILLSGNLKELFTQINKQSISLENLLGSDNISNGIQTSGNDVFINNINCIDKKYIYFFKDNKCWQIEKFVARGYFKTATYSISRAIDSAFKIPDGIYFFTFLLPFKFNLIINNKIILAFECCRKDSIYLYFRKNNIDNTLQHQYPYIQRTDIENTFKVEKKFVKPFGCLRRKKDNTQNSLNTYRYLKRNAFVIYPYKKVDDKIKLIEIDELEKKYPYAFKYLSFYKDKLENRDIKPKPETSNEWYRYGRHQSLDKCDVSEKIVVGVLSKGNKYSIDFKKTLVSSGGTAGYVIITLPNDFKYSIYYIQALLNSKYLEWFASLIGEVFRGGYIARGTKVLKKLPIRIIDFNNSKDKKLHDEISGLQRSLIDTQAKIDRAKKRGDKRDQDYLQRKFNNDKNKLDNELKVLYNLEDDSLIPTVVGN